MLQLIAAIAATGSCSEASEAELEALRLLASPHKLSTQDETVAMQVLAGRAADGRLDEESCRSMLKLCVRRSSGRTALKVLTIMDLVDMPMKRDIKQNMHELTLEACAGETPHNDVIARMKGKDLHFDGKTYLHILKGCLRTKNFNAGWRAWQFMRNDGLWPGENGILVFLKLCADAKQWKVAEDALREGVDTEGFKMHQQHWHAVLTACARAGALSEANRIFEALPHARVVEDFCSMLTCLCINNGSTLSLGERELAVKALLTRMRDAGFEQNEVIYNLLFDVYQFDAAKVVQLLLEMREAKVPPSWSTYKKVVRTLLRARRSSEAYQIISIMEAEGFQLNAPFFKFAERSANAVGLFDVADKLHRECLALGVGETSKLSDAKRCNHQKVPYF